MHAPIDLNLVRSFVAVRETGSFSGAGARLGVPRSTVSRAVAALEESLGLRLFHRTTRSVSVTAAGTALFERVAASLGALESSLTDLPEQESEPAGLLRISTTVDIGTAILAEAIARFTLRYPAVDVEMLLTSRVTNLVSERIDLALRVLRKPARDSTLVMRKVGLLELRLYAAPAYLARRGAPRSVEALREHDFIGFHGAEALTLVGPGRRYKLGGSPRIRSDDMSFNREMLRAGAGIGIAPTFFCDADVASGALVRVLPRWVAFTGTVYLVQPSNKHVPRKVVAFRELLIDLLRRSPLVPPSSAEAR